MHWGSRKESDGRAVCCLLHAALTTSTLRLTVRALDSPAALLARDGVSPGVAQKLMRHSDIRLTMNTYTHLGLADTAIAVAALPAF